MRSLLEKALTHLLNEESDKAEALFRKFMVERAKQINEARRLNEDGEDPFAGGGSGESEDPFAGGENTQVDSSPAGENIAEGLPSDPGASMDAAQDDDASPAVADDGTDLGVSKGTMNQMHDMEANPVSEEDEEGHEHKTEDERVAELEDQLANLKHQLAELLGDDACEMDDMEDLGDSMADDHEGEVDEDAMPADGSTGDGSGSYSVGGSDYSNGTGPGIPELGGDDPGASTGGQTTGMAQSTAPTEPFEEAAVDEDHDPNGSYITDTPDDFQGMANTAPVSEGEGDDEGDDAESMSEAVDAKYADMLESLAADLEKITVSMKDGQEIGKGKSFSQNNTSPALQKKPDPNKDGKPVKVVSKDHTSFERETPPTTKTVKKAENNRTKATDGTSKVSKEGNKSASLNKSWGGSENTKSPLAKR